MNKHARIKNHSRRKVINMEISEKHWFIWKLSRVIRCNRRPATAKNPPVTSRCLILSGFLISHQHARRLSRRLFFQSCKSFSRQYDKKEFAKIRRSNGTNVLFRDNEIICRNVLSITTCFVWFDRKEKIKLIWSSERNGDSVYTTRFFGDIEIKSFLHLRTILNDCIWFLCYDIVFIATIMLR